MKVNTEAPTLRRRMLLPLAVAVLLAGIAADAFLIEPNWLQVNSYEIAARVTAPLKIAQLSDVHTSGYGRREQRTVELLEAERPDVIVITGDTLGSNGGDYEKCRRFYEKLHAPLGVWFVRGNWENWQPLRREKAFYEAAGVHLLVNSHAKLRDDVWLIGLDDPFSGTAEPELAMEGVPNDAYRIMLFHSPGYFHHLAGKMDLCLTGHTHGGQVRIPFVHPFWLPGGCGPYLEGWYAANGSRMYVSRGIGMSVLPMRFLCRPELVFFTLKPE